MRGFEKLLAIGGVILSLGVFCSASVYDVTDYGATGNGSTHDHGAVNAAINAANGAGGGTVYFPPGTYKCGSIILKSNVTLNLHADAEIQATMDYYYTMWDSFPCTMYQDWGHSHWKCSLIWAIDQSNIGITGSGLIDGTDPATNYTGLDKGDPDPGFADRAISFKNCTGITIDGIKMLRGGHFAIIATGCTDVALSNLFIDTNRDGINIDCCNDVTITNCIVNAPCDDAIGLKSSYALCEKRATENVIVSGCTVMGYEVGSVMSGSPIPNTNPSCYSCGSIKFGTESNGGFKNITITDCTFENSRGFMLATVDGGDIENIYIDNIQMSLINDTPIFLRLGDRARGPGPPPPGTYRNVNINNITCPSSMSRLSCIASGIPGHYIEGVYLSGLNISYAGGGTAADATIVLPENEDGYPYGGMFGSVTPCYGFYARHVDGLIFNNCVFNLNSPDARPEFKFIDALNVEFDNFGIISDITSPSNGSSVYYGDDVTFTGSALGGTPPYTYTWQSNVDGFLGNGEQIIVSDLSVAHSGGQVTAHTITLTVEDSNNESDTDQIELTVKFHADFEPDGDVDFEDCSVFSNDWLKDTGQMFLPADPVAWWKFEEGSGSYAYDSSVNSNTGTLYYMDSSDWVTGHDGGALDFDGGNDYISVNDSDSISVGGGDYTICAWIYPHSISGSRGIVAKIKSNSDKEFAFSLGNDDAMDGALGLDVENNANDGAEYTAPIVTTGEWQHVMVIFDSTAKDAYFYHNFNPVPLYSSISNPITALPRYFDDNLCIGRWGGTYNSKYFDGIIDDVRIYDYSLLQANLQADFNQDDIVDFKDFARLALEWLK